MFSPQQRVLQTVNDNSEMADALYDVLFWVRSAKGIMDQAEVDDFMRSVYARTTDCEKHQKAKDKRLGRIRRRPIVEEAENELPA